MSFLGSLESSAFFPVRSFSREVAVQSRGVRRDRFQVHGGLADVKDDTVSVLTGLAERPEDVDISTARADIEAVSRKIDGLQDEEGPAERAQLERRLRVAQARARE